MKEEMIEAARLAREGRLAEAAALVQKTMTSGPAAARTRTRFMDVLARMKAKAENPPDLKRPTHPRLAPLAERLPSAIHAAGSFGPWRTARHA